MNEEQRGRGSKRRGFVLACVMAGGAALGVAACGGGDTASGGAGPADDGGVVGDAMAEDAGPTIDVPRVTVGGDGKVTLGAASDPKGFWEDIQLSVPYAISRFPITVGEYAACVDAGVCHPPDLDVCGTLETNGSFDPCRSRSAATYNTKYWDLVQDYPVTCVSPDLAQEFCEWVGGSLATVGEWMYAARGPTVQPYPWGSEPPTCDQNPNACGLLDWLNGCPERAPAEFAVGHHPAGASWAGVEDVELVDGELSANEPNADSWGGPTSMGFAIVTFYNDPGRISYSGTLLAPDPWHDGSTHVLSFRCTWRSP